MLEDHPFVSWELGNGIGKQQIVPMLLAQTLRSAIGASPPFEETASGFVSGHFLLRCVKLRRRQFLGSGLVRNDSFLDFLVIAPLKKIKQLEIQGVLTVKVS